jgi:hypothetical protein
VSPFSVTVPDVPDRELGPLLTQLAEAGFDDPLIRHIAGAGAADGAAAPARRGPLDLPGGWRLVREREAESYQWPKRRDRYSPYRVFLGTTRAEGAVQIGLGETIREFAAADDYAQTSELVAVIRGSDGGRRMYSAGDTLPAVYAERFRTEIYNERIVYPGAWNKLVVVAREDDHETMLNHALIQSRRRYRA